MIAPNLLNLYVDDPVRSADFYRRLLARETVEHSPASPCSSSTTASSSASGPAVA